MNNLKLILKSRKGYSMTEMLVAAVLLCVAITLVSMVLSPAANVIRRLDDLNNAQVIADGLLESIRFELEKAQGYIKCYNDGSVIADTKGTSSGQAVEFKNSDGYAVLISADGCAETNLRRPSGDAGVSDSVAPGYLLLRYYQYDTGNSYIYSESGNHIARALTVPFARGYYMGFKAEFDFELKSGDMALVTVSLYKGDAAELVYSDTLTVDLRYSPNILTDVTAEAR